MTIMSVLFDFQKYCLGAKSDVIKVIAGIDWQELYSFASKQALLGLCFEGIERLGMKNIFSTHNVDNTNRHH